MIICDRCGERNPHPKTNRSGNYICSKCGKAITETVRPEQEGERISPSAYRKTPAKFEGDEE